MQLVLPSLTLLRRLPHRTGGVLHRDLLPARSTLGFRTRKEVHIVCIRGKVWITDGVSGDVVLSDGDQFAIGKNSRVVIEALEKALVEIGG
jgi:hypothetical protein